MTTPDPPAALHQTLAGILARAVSAGVTPSASCAVVLHGTALPAIFVGDAVRYGDDGAELPEGARVPAGPDTFYDLASVTKVFTAVTALSLVDSGVLALDEPLGRWLAPYRQGAKADVTLRHLLTHASGLPAVWPGWRPALASGRPFQRKELLADVVATPLEAGPGTRFEYSCVGYNTAMALAEAATGQPWAELVRDRILSHLDGAAGLSGTPSPQDCAATEFQPELGRGMVQGVVHDESAWSLGGLSGNAGMFGTVAGLGSFARALLAGLPGILSPGLAREMYRDQLPAVLGGNLGAGGPGYGHGLGLRIGQETWMGTGQPEGRGHNGFTGTSLLVDRNADISVVLLSNRVHPGRSLSDVQPLRLAVSSAVYAAARTS